MKTTFNLLVSLVFVTLLFSQCKKEDTIFKGYFYTSNSTSEAKLFLYLDEVYMGELPYINTKQSGFNADSIKKYALPIAVKSGKHEQEAKDQNGTTRSKGKFKVSKNKMSSSGGIGGQELVSEKGELRIGLSF